MTQIKDNSSKLGTFGEIQIKYGITERTAPFSMQPTLHLKKKSRILVTPWPNVDFYQTTKNYLGIYEIKSRTKQNHHFKIRNFWRYVQFKSSIKRDAILHHVHVTLGKNPNHPCL